MEGKSKKILLWTADLAINIVIIIGLVFVIQTWIIAPFDVSGASMCNTLNIVEDQCQNGYGEKIIINEATYVFGEPVRGDIVVFKAPIEEDKYFIKRIIGLPGDTIEIKNGEVFITQKGSNENIQIEEQYLNENNKGNTKTYFSEFGVFEVPEDKYFVMGDNRNASTDSRSCFAGTIDIDCKQHPEKAFVDRKNIRGKAWLVWWPLPNMRIVDHPEYPELQIPTDQNNSLSREEK